jgi:hypothetical protein
MKVENVNLKVTPNAGGPGDEGGCWCCPTWVCYGVGIAAFAFALKTVVTAIAALGSE